MRVEANMKWSRRALAALTAYGFMRGLSIGFYRAFFSYYMKELGYSMAQIGGVASLGTLISFLLLPSVGSLIDYYSSRISVILTGLLGLLAMGLLGMPPSLSIFAISYILYTMAFLLGQPARTTYLARSLPKERLGFYLSVVSFSFSLAGIIGPSIGGVMVKNLGYRKSFLIYAIIWTAGLAMFSILAPYIPEGRGRMPSIEELTKRYRTILKVPKEIKDITVIASIDRTGWTLWMPMLTAHLYNLGYTKEEVGLIFGVFGISRTVTMLAWGRITDLIGANKVLFLAEVFGSLGTLLISKATSTFYAYLSVTFIGLSIAAWIPSYNKFIAESMPTERYGEAYTTTNAYRSLVGTPMPYIGGFMYDSVGILPLFSLSAVLILTAGILSLLSKRK